jgi:serine protease Do
MSGDFLNNNENQRNSMEPDINNSGTNHTNASDSSESQANSNQGNDNRKGTSSAYSFWAEQIAATSQNQSGSYYQNDQYNHYYDGGGNYNGNNSYNNNYNSYNNYSSGYGTPEGGKGRKNSKGIRFLKKAGKLVASAAIFGLVAGVFFVGFNVVYHKINPDAPSYFIQFDSDNNLADGFQLSLASDSEDSSRIEATKTTDGNVKQDTDISDVIDDTMPSIVQITTTYTQSYNWFGQQFDQQNEGGGSGIIVGKNENELLIATNNHVVEGADPIKVTFIDGTDATAIIKGTDAVADLAVISIDLSDIKSSTLSEIKVATLGDSDSVKVGEMVIAIGNALGYGQSTTVGYISAKDREVKVDDKTMVLLQTDAAINPGNSGGALLNLKGEVIGINTVKYASDEVEGMGFAIPISRATPIINELMSRETLTDDEKGFLGVAVKDVTEDVAEAFNWPVGVYVYETTEGGSAQKAGILAGDIIVKVNDTEITSSTQLKEKISSYRVGTEVTITVKRNSGGEFVEKQFKVKLGKNPENTDKNTDSGNK